MFRADPPPLSGILGMRRALVLFKSMIPLRPSLPLGSMSYLPLRRSIFSAPDASFFVNKCAGYATALEPFRYDLSLSVVLFFSRPASKSFPLCLVLAAPSSRIDCPEPYPLVRRCLLCRSPIIYRMNPVTPHRYLYYIKESRVNLEFSNLSGARLFVRCVNPLFWSH